MELATVYSEFGLKFFLGFKVMMAIHIAPSLHKFLKEDEEDSVEVSA